SASTDRRWRGTSASPACVLAVGRTRICLPAPSPVYGGRLGWGRDRRRGASTAAPALPHPSPPPQAGEGVVCPFPPADGVVCRSPRAVEGVVCPLLYAGRGHLLLPPFPRKKRLSSLVGVGCLAWRWRRVRQRPPAPCVRTRRSQRPAPPLPAAA